MGDTVVFRIRLGTLDLSSNTCLCKSIYYQSSDCVCETNRWMILEENVINELYNMLLYHTFEHVADRNRR